MKVFPQTTHSEQGQHLAAKRWQQAWPVGMWSQLSREQQQHLSQIIAAVIRRGRAPAVEEEKRDGDIV